MLPFMGSQRGRRDLAAETAVQSEGLTSSPWFHLHGRACAALCSFIPRGALCNHRDN